MAPLYGNDAPLAVIRLMLPDERLKAPPRLQNLYIDAVIRYRPEIGLSLQSSGGGVSRSSCDRRFTSSSEARHGFVGTSASALLPNARLGTDAPAIMLDREDVTVEGGGPLLPLHRHVEITQSVADVPLDLAPKKLRVVVDHIGWTGIAELLVHAVFDKLVIEGVQFARIKRIAQLTDEIASPD